jgi:predicted RNA-binding protein with PUA-like domain
MKYWLVKSEPGTYSWTDMVKDRRTRWDGVRNFQARNNLRAMQPGDLALFYHSGDEKSIPGVARIVSKAYADPTAHGEDWSVVDVEAAFALRKPVGLDQIKREAALKKMVLVKQSRLSVQPVAKAEFDRIVAMGSKAPL